MPIFSYLAIPRDGAKQRLCTALAALAHCRTLPADNHEVILLITDTPDQSTEDALQEKLKNLPDLQALNLAFGYDEH